MKNLKTFNENWIRRKIYKDEDIAEGIYKSLMSKEFEKSDVIFSNYNNKNTQDRSIIPTHLKKFIHKDGNFFSNTSGNYEPFIYKINIDDFNIESIRFVKLYFPSRHIMGREIPLPPGVQPPQQQLDDSINYYCLFIDGEKMDISKSLNKKIYKELKSIYEGRSVKNYIRKDARINFK